MKKMSKGMLMAALICGAVYLVGSTPVYANELQEFALDEYVVTAARTETKLVDTPANISVVDAQTIEERHYQDVSEVLKDVPGANVLDTGVGAYEKTIKLNGDDRVLILIDGRRVNTDMGTMNARSSYDMNQMPDVGLIERIEVLKGAGGALYGSDAVGGVVNIITKKADRNLGKVSVAIGSMGTEDYSAMYSIKEGKTGVTVTASKYEQDYYKYKDAKNDKTQRWPFSSKYENEKVSLKVDQEIKSGSNLTLGYDYSKFEGYNPYNAINTSRQYTSYLEKKTQNIYAKYDWTIKELDHGYIQLYHNKYEYDNKGGMEEKTYGLDLQQVVTTSNSNKIVIGVSYRDSEAENDRAFNSSDIQNIAVFVNDNWEFAPTWTLNTGVRYDDHSEAGDETTMNIGLNKKFDDNSHAYINWGQVFKAPTIDDLYYFDESSDEYGSYNTYGDPNLKPETGDSWTIGYQTKLNEQTDFGISYFRSDLEDAISWEYDNYFSDDGDYTNDIYNTVVKNVDKQKKRGMEVIIDHEINKNIDLTASYTYMKAKNNEGTGYVRDWNYMPNTYRLGVRYHDGKWNTNLWLRAGSGGATHTYDYNKQAYADSSYWTVDMAVTYNATKDLIFYAKGYNLFNESYAELAGVSGGSYYYPAQSRRFIVGAEYKF